MNIGKFLAEVYNNLPRHEDVAMELNETCIKVKFGNNNEFEIRAPGGICFTPDTVMDDKYELLRDEVDAAVKTVKEYLWQMGNSPPLKARDFNMPYKKLAEFNGVVLGGIEHESSGSFEFTTWTYADNSLYHGHYYTDYNKAKEDFAIRSGLVKEQKIFNDKELCEIFRCIEDTMTVGFALSDEQTKLLERIQEQIKVCVPNIYEMAENAEEQEFEQSM